jgi:hypothetical protein
VLHAALDAAIADRDAASSGALKHAVKRICIDARRNDWPPEWLLIAFKGALYTLPAVQRHNASSITRLRSACTTSSLRRRVALGARTRDVLGKCASS